MIDPMVSVAFSVYSNKGGYALLLGSGVSRASGIPTGWEVVLDLIRKVAKLEGEDCEPDPGRWLKEKHSLEPDYSKLLDLIAKTPTERQQVLRAYFEPTDDERSQGLKSPSIAHKAIAQLVSGGHIRVIITTNFDRLLEKSLEDAGIAPTVISTSDQIAGALPLAHSGVTLVKLHGDYLDTRIRNTEAELASYDPALTSILARVVDEYGLIICGWSADWDIALRAAIETCPSRRFTTFWATRSTLVNHAKRLAEHRRAEVIQISDANQFFESLSEKVRALADIAAPHPLSAKMAAATAKRYLVDPMARIRLRDLIHEETERLCTELKDEAFPAQTRLQPADELKSRVAKYEALSEVLLALMVTGCYWGEEQYAKLWAECLERIANTSESGAGLVYLVKLRRYPALLLLYSGGLAAIASGKYQTLAALLTRAQAKNDRGDYEPLCSLVHSIAVMETDVGQLLPGMERHYTPVSDRLFAMLRNPLREFIPRDDKFQSVFDRFEYLLGLVHADINRWALNTGWWGPVGCFSWRWRRSPELQIMGEIAKEIESEGKDWPPLKAGLFGGSLEQLKEARSKFDAFVSGLPRF